MKGKEEVKEKATFGDCITWPERKGGFGEEDVCGCKI